MGRYITNLAEGFIGQLKARIEAEDRPVGGGDFLAQNLYQRHCDAIIDQLRRMRPETLGKIAAYGRGADDTTREIVPGEHGTTLYQVHCGTWLGKYNDGMTLLRDIACTAIVAEMANILKRRATP